MNGMARQMTIPRVLGRSVDPGGSVPAKHDSRRPLALARSVGLSWLIPVLLWLVHLDVLVLPLLVVLIAGLIRVGGGLLDRIVIAAFLLAGALMTLGLLASIWPWGLNPLPASGVLLTAISVAAWLDRRRFRLVWRVRGTDAIILGTGAVVGYLVRHGVTAVSSAGRYAEMTIGDRVTHFAIFDTVERVGGYLFLNQTAANASVSGNTAEVYPQGSHFLLAWIDIFVRSSTSLTAAPQAYDRYCAYTLAGFVVFCMSLIWGARWIGGPRLRGWRAAAVCSVVAAIVLGSPFSMLLSYGFDSEIVGLAFLAVSIALLVRPAMGLVEYALVAGAALVTVGYAYNIFDAFVGIALLGGLLVYWRRHRGHRVALYTALGVGGLLAITPSLISVLSSFDVGQQAQAAGHEVSLSRALLIALTAVVLVGVVSAGRRLGATASILGITVVGGAFVIAVFGAWQLHTLGHLSYYFEKMATAGLIISLVGLGSAGWLLRPVRRAAAAAPWPVRLREPLLSVGASVVALSLFAGVQWGVPSVDNAPSQWKQTSLWAWAKGKSPADIAPLVHTFLRRDLARTTGTAIILYTNNGARNWQATYFASAMARNGRFGALSEGLEQVGIGATAGTEATYQAALAQLRAVIQICPDGATLFVGNQALASRLQDDLDTDGVRNATVLYAPLH